MWWPSRKLWGILVLYGLMLGALTWAAFRARQAALEELATPAAQAAWKQWQGDVEAGTVPDEGVVARRTPESPEPPWLVLMRDHFAVCLTALLVFSSLLFAVTTSFVLAVQHD